MTSICARIQDDAGGLMSLGADDSERRAAVTHAVTCAPCAAALAEAGAVLELLDRAAPLPVSSGVLLARTRQGIVDQIARETPCASAATAPREEAPPDARLLGVLAGVLAASWLLSILKHLGSGTPVAVSSLTAIAAIAAGVTALRRGGVWLVLLAVAAFACVAIDAGRAGLQPMQGVECSLFELAFALVPLGATLAFARRGRGGAPTFAAAAGAGSGALVAQAALHVACHSSSSTAHALVFHAGPVLLAIAAGAVAGGVVGRHTRAI